MNWLQRIFSTGTAIVSVESAASAAPTVVEPKMRIAKPPKLAWELIAWRKVNMFDWELVVHCGDGEAVLVRGPSEGYGILRYFPTGVALPREMQSDLNSIIETIKWGLHSDKKAIP